MSNEDSSSQAVPFRSVAYLVHAIAEKDRARIALRPGCRAMSYGDLDAKAGQMATCLRSLGVGREVPVGIAVERSVTQIVAILAVLRAGGAFLPLDPAWPTERLRSLLDDAGAPVVITSAGLADRLASDNRVTVGAEAMMAAAATADALSLPDVAAADLAYIIYTSGTSGGPRGVEITHGNLLNLISWHQRAFGVTEKDCGSHIAGLGFDAAIWEVWPYLTAGAVVALPNDEAVRRSPDLLRDWLVDQRVSIAFAPTAIAEALVAREWPPMATLRLLLTGGEKLHSHPPAGLPFALVNNYGPTECTVVTTSGIVSPAAGPGAVPAIGMPIANTQILLLDESEQVVADGGTGEIYIAGAGVGRGYRHRPEQTAQSFVTDRPGPLAGLRLYRTGDLGCRRADGAIAFRGRLDRQVKIRGHRVEPDEIAGALNRHPAVAASAVIAQDDGHNGTRLIAYVVPHKAAAPWRELRMFLAESLPDYMLPTSFFYIDALPLTANGKIDHAGLLTANPGAPATDDFATALSPTERRLTRIIADVSGVEQVSVRDNFFLIGGHSLSGTQVVLRAREAFGVEMTLRHLFEAETIADLAATIERLAVARILAISDDDARRILTGQP